MYKWIYTCILDMIQPCRAGCSGSVHPPRGRNAFFLLFFWKFFFRVSTGHVVKNSKEKGHAQLADHISRDDLS